MILPVPTWLFSLRNNSINNSEYPSSLELFKIYRIIYDEVADADVDLRVIDESGEDYLYPADYFVPIEVPKYLLQKAW